jgi:hypothetical protein
LPGNRRPHCCVPCLVIWDPIKTLAVDGTCRLINGLCSDHRHKSRHPNYMTAALGLFRLALTSGAVTYATQYQT